ncbi:MAG: bifunctional indole-3-glycerol phosphate synthase/phosphoribosylanthranilate isomerase [Treponema sp.]|uniref:bifunctional indole-3-glycerol phosphate synthase/phosphoribosylanthranilate isomerase n=1 Tax=Treponema sp. TaxID=166 RepID=UPI00298E123C|nr:bifunctional indole-3-glycerol phosphate synthase/phosphoribosylanthranilate isomerase [Treponema sp.]MBR5933559.1 bifunctional indole-3-glycerol phosphate synthase/phosphoribosylanthranilate isomerase [Treponema sp.]
MSDILTEIVERRKEDIKKSGFEFGCMIPKKRSRQVHSFLNSKGVILEIKRASPSKGDIAPLLEAGETAFSYATAGAGAVSCLTESNYFKGTLLDLMAVCKAVDKFSSAYGRMAPSVLRKDFLIDEQEVEVSYRAGADAVLLIARILETDKLVKMAKTAANLNMTSLVEVRSDEDLKKLSKLSAMLTDREKNLIVCGVNSRDLSDFKIDLLKPCSMLKKIKEILGKNAKVIFESGIRTGKGASFAGSLGFTGLLSGEAAARNSELRKEIVSSFVYTKKTLNADFWNEISSIISLRKRPLIKICGITNPEDAVYADKLGSDFIGFIFADGFKRNVMDGRFEKIIPVLNDIKAKKIAVVTDIESQETQKAYEYIKKGILDCIQFHGIRYESIPEKFFEIPHYFAITEKSGDALKVSNDLFLNGEPRFLQDIKSNEYIKYSSEKNEASDNNLNLWLAGGVNPDNVLELYKKYSPELIDISSGVEEQENIGIKSHKKLDALFKKINSI